MNFKGRTAITLKMKWQEKNENFCQKTKRARNEQTILWKKKLRKDKMERIEWKLTTMIRSVIKIFSIHVLYLLVFACLLFACLSTQLFFFLIKCCLWIFFCLVQYIFVWATHTYRDKPKMTNTSISFSRCLTKNIKITTTTTKLNSIQYYATNKPDTLYVNEKNVANKKIRKDLPNQASKRISKWKKMNKKP